jgi:hypothetical protein
MWPHLLCLLLVLSLLSMKSDAAYTRPDSLTDLADRAVGDVCKALEGQGSCLEASKCVGITYKGLCPKDIASVQVRIQSVPACQQ